MPADLLTLYFSGALPSDLIDRRNDEMPCLLRVEIALAFECPEREAHPVVERERDRDVGDSRCASGICIQRRTAGMIAGV